MATVVNLNEKQNSNADFEMPEKLRALLEERKKAKREPLTPETLRKGKGLENLSDEEALKAIDSIKKLAAILFEMACNNETTCIDNQQVVHLKQQNKAA
jgi:hypothetical protein